MLNFLSGDNWSFDFRARNINEIESSAQKGIDRRRKKINPDSICMLSGGLDSFIGAINLLERSNNICFVGHYGGGKGVSVYQNKINHILQEQYTLTKDYFFNFYAAPIIEGSKDDTTRTRSFMFFSHAIILASGMNKEIDLFIPENGLISLNIPMIINRIGSSSTRTTHPYYMKLLQQLIHNLNIRVNLHNPFQFNTWSKNEYHYTFWSDNKRQLYQVMNHFSLPAIDLFNISLMVYYADRAVLRNEEDDAWTRSIKIYMPVLELDVWNSNKTLLVFRAL